MDFLMSDAVRLKLRTRHKVSDQEIIECFKNRTHRPLIDDREQHRTYPPTMWFIAQTATGRELKIVFMQAAPTKFIIKTAYDANEKIKQIYDLQTKG